MSALLLVPLVLVVLVLVRRTSTSTTSYMKVLVASKFTLEGRVAFLLQKSGTRQKRKGRGFAKKRANGRKGRVGFS